MSNGKARHPPIQSESENGLFTKEVIDDYVLNKCDR